MSFHVIGEEEIVIGFRFVGVPGTVVYTKDEAQSAFQEILRSSGVRVLILTEQVSSMLEDEVTQWQFNGSYPLIVEVPGLEGHLENRKSLLDSIREAVGLHV